jgi:hypothetical protein
MYCELAIGAPITMKFVQNGQKMKYICTGFGNNVQFKTINVQFGRVDFGA